MTEDLREAVAEAIRTVDDAFGYHIRLSKLVDGEATYTLDYQDGTPVLEFASHADAADHTVERRSAIRADAAIAIVLEYAAKVADAENEEVQGHMSLGWRPAHFAGYADGAKRIARTLRAFATPARLDAVKGE